MYGIGEQNTPGTLSMRSMGGAGWPCVRQGTLNLLNPAAYSAAQQKTFLFNFGLEGQNYYNSQKVAGESKNTAYNTFNFHDIAFQMPLARKLGLGFSPDALQFGGVPTKYYHEYDPTDPVYGNVGNVQYNYQGEGDVTEVKLGIGWEVFKNFSIGVAAQYYWGDIDRTFVMTPTAITGEGNLYLDGGSGQLQHFERQGTGRSAVEGDPEPKTPADVRRRLRFRRGPEPGGDQAALTSATSTTPSSRATRRT